MAAGVVAGDEPEFRPASGFGRGARANGMNWQFSEDSSVVRPHAAAFSEGKGPDGPRADETPTIAYAAPDRSRTAGSKALGAACGACAMPLLAWVAAARVQDLCERLHMYPHPGSITASLVFLSLNLLGLIVALLAARRLDRLARPAWLAVAVAAVIIDAVASFFAVLILIVDLNH